MHVMVFEPRYKGHHLYYVRILLAALKGCGVRITFAGGSDVLDSAEYAAQLRPHEAGVEVIRNLAPLEGSRNAIVGMEHMFREAIGRCRPDHVLAPTADGLAQRLGVLGLTGRAAFLQEVEVEVNVLRCRFAYPAASFRDKVKLGFIRRVLAACPVSRLLTIDGVAVEHLKARGGRLGERIEAIADPLDEASVPSKEDARRMLGLPVAGRYFVLTGVLDGRKGIGRLLEAFSRAQLREDDRVLIAGKPQPEVEALLADPRWTTLRQSGKLLTIERLLSDQHMAAAIGAADVICVPYIDHVGPSAMVTRSLTCGRPVIGTAYGWMGEMIPRLGAGWVCDTADAAAFASVIKQALAQGDGPWKSPLAERMTRFLTPDNFCAAFLRRIRERLGLPAAPEIQWEQVFGPRGQ